MAVTTPRRRQLVVLVAVVVLTAVCAGEAGLPDPAGLPAAEGPRLLVIGDWGAGSEAQDRLGEAMAVFAESGPINAIVTTGDNFYDDDEDALMEPMDWATEADIPLWITWGNHDIESEERIEVINDVFDDPPRWTVRRWGPIEVVLLDSTQITNPGQLAFLEKQMTGSTRPAILAFHHPPWSCGAYLSTPGIIEEWLPLFDEDVFLVLSGHDHNYQRFVTDEANYVITGGGGRALNEIKQCEPGLPENVEAEATHHFVALELIDSNLVLTAYRSDLSVIEQVELPIEN